MSQITEAGRGDIPRNGATIPNFTAEVFSFTGNKQIFFRDLNGKLEENGVSSGANSGHG